MSEGDFDFDTAKNEGKTTKASGGDDDTIDLICVFLKISLNLVVKNSVGVT